MRRRETIYFLLILGVALTCMITSPTSQAQAQDLFSDVPEGHWAYGYIMNIYNAGITAGCSQNPPLYCPEETVSREQMAVFIIRALNQVPADGYCGTTNPFPDVSSDRWSCKYIKKLAELGITTGYGDGRFGPEDAVTREQMAVFLTKALDSVPQDGYCGSTDPFTDVPFLRWSCKYVKELAELGITTGYGDGRFGPDDYVTRAQMAVFLSRAFLADTEPGIKLVRPIQVSQDYSGDLILLGELKNTTSTAVTFVKANCSFYDSASNLIGEDYSYVIGTVLQLTLIDSNTNTALRPQDVGYFKIWTDLPRNTVSSYSCEFTYETYETRNPFAKLEIIGDIVAQPDYFDDVKFTGLVKNTGTKGLIFGEVYLISKDLLGSILDIDFSFIDGETVTLESLGSTTDTALNINSQGSFSIFTSIPLSSYNSTQPKYSWDDADIQGGIAMMAEKQVSTDSIPNLSKRDQLIRRNEKIEQLRETLLR